MKSTLFYSLAFFVLFSCHSDSSHSNIPDNYPWQGHRGARGLMPENTIPAFKKAIDLGMPVLELDLAVSADSQLIVSHEPWMSAEICVDENGQEMTAEQGEALKIYTMTADEIALYDCGSKAHARFPEQKKMKLSKPTFKDMVRNCEKYAAAQGKPAPFYNIEIKSAPVYDTIYTPTVADFVRLTLAEIEVLGISERSNLQSFDLRALEEIHQQNPLMPVAYLVEDATDTEAALAQLSFTPDIYSPYHRLVNLKMMDICREKNIKVIPWTVNETSRMRELVKLGVHGVITDYPNQIPMD